MKKNIWILLLVCLLAAGIFFRVWRLGDRPMHTDEAVHADKFKALFEDGFYAYDPDEFHGPTLNYSTLLVAWFQGQGAWSEVNEATLRLTPAIFGVMLILTPLFFLQDSSRRAAFFSCLLIAFSPAFVYYSRYYIQEMLLVFFTACFLGCGWRYLSSRRSIWIILSGVSAGLMHASKETFVFSLIAAALAFGVCTFCAKPGKLKPSHLLAGALAMGLTSVLFFSSFGTNPTGILDSVATYGIWIQRAAGDSPHLHPWYYYLDLITWLEFIEPISWNEDGIVALGFLGFILAFAGRKTVSDKVKLVRFWGGYTITLMMIYCLIPYKTPWCMLSFLFGLVMLAGFVLDWLTERLETVFQKYAIGLLIAIFVVLSPVIQSWCLNFYYSSEPSNPYVYAHTSTDIYAMAEAVEKVAAISPEGQATPIHIIAEGKDYWPFPWYLRDFSQVGYWTQVDNSASCVPIILANAECEQELLRVLYDVPPAGRKQLYVPLFDQMLQLRPGVEWRGYVRSDLWEQMHSESEPGISAETDRPGALGVQPDKNKIGNLVQFSHRAMHANFEVFIQHEDGTYAGRAARAAFNEVDRLEGLLSRYIDNSDVSRINALDAPEEAVVDEDTIKCLQIARRAYRLTDGAFNIAIGSLIAARKQGDPIQPSTDEIPSPEMLEIDQETYTVKALQEGVNLDLGGIGKGYAIDVIAQVLDEWGIKKALIHAGASSVLALQGPEERTGWPIIIRNPDDDSVIAQLELSEEVFSSSGLQRGGHIIDPSTGQPVTDRRACWIRLQKSAALADALTTAGMIMTKDQLRDLHEVMPEMSLMILTTGKDDLPQLFKLGSWTSE